MFYHFYAGSGQTTIEWKPTWSTEGQSTSDMFTMYIPSTYLEIYMMKHDPLKITTCSIVINY